MAERAAHHEVCVVVDPAYAGRLEELAAAAPVWIVSSAMNREACQQAWAAPGAVTDHHLPGSITHYDISDPADRVSNLLDVLPVLEQHYGDPDDPAYRPLADDVQRRYLHLPNGFGLSVIGLSLTPDVEHRLKDFGFESFSSTATGFQCWVQRRLAD